MFYAAFEPFRAEPGITRWRALFALPSIDAAREAVAKVKHERRHLGQRAPALSFRVVPETASLVGTCGISSPMLAAYPIWE